MLKKSFLLYFFFFVGLGVCGPTGILSTECKCGLVGLIKNYNSKKEFAFLSMFANGKEYLLDILDSCIFDLLNKEKKNEKINKFNGISTSIKNLLETDTKILTLEEIYIDQNDRKIIEQNLELVKRLRVIFVSFFLDLIDIAKNNKKTEREKEQMFQDSFSDLITKCKEEVNKSQSNAAFCTVTEHAEKSWRDDIYLPVYKEINDVINRINNCDSYHDIPPITEIEKEINQYICKINRIFIKKDTKNRLFKTRKKKFFELEYLDENEFDETIRKNEFDETIRKKKTRIKKIGIGFLFFLVFCGFGIGLYFLIQDNQKFDSEGNLLSIKNNMNSEKSL